MVDTWNAAQLNDAVNNGSIGGGGEGATTLSGLTDVTITTPVAGNALVYDDTNSKWVNGAVTATASLSTLTDVELTTPSGGNVLTYDSTSEKWVNGTVSGSGESYSNNEVAVGTWTDGSTVYKKTFHITTMPNATSLNIPTNITNLAHIIDFSGGIYASDGTHSYYRPLPFFSKTAANSIMVEASESDITITTSINYTDYAGDITIKYVKTT